MSDLVRLYHYTSPKGGAVIPGQGFAGLVWLSPDPATVCGQAARGVLIEVMLRLGAEDLAPYRREVEEQEIDPVTEEPVPGSPVDRHYWYEIPAAIIRRRGAVRVIGPEERRLLNAGYPADEARRPAMTGPKPHEGEHP